MKNDGFFFVAMLSPNPDTSMKDQIKNTMGNSFSYHFVHKDNGNDEDFWFDDTKSIKFDEDLQIDDTIRIEFDFFNDDDILEHMEAYS